MTREEIIKGLLYGYNCTEKDECFEGGCRGCIDLIFAEYEKQIRADAIDDFVQKVKEHQYLLSDVINSKDYGMFTVGLEQIAEELKEQI